MTPSTSRVEPSKGTACGGLPRLAHITRPHAPSNVTVTPGNDGIPAALKSGVPSSPPQIVFPYSTE